MHSRSVLSLDKKKFKKLMSLTIVTSHWKEDLNWLLQSKFPVVLIDKEGADPSPLVPQHVIPNVGKESTAYLKYIIENYDNLPEAMAFIHGHETSYHQRHKRPLLEVIEGANWEKYGFIPLNNNTLACDFKDDTFVKKTPSMWTPCYFLRLYTFFQKLCIPVCGEEFPRENSPWLHDQGAQFVVTRERIRANPKMLYEGWYHIFTHNLDFSEEFGYILEKCWHVTFGEPPVHLPQKDWFSFDWTPLRGMNGELDGSPLGLWEADEPAQQP